MLPILLIMLYIPADFGIAFFMGNLTANAAREGARIGSGLGKSSGTDYSANEAVTVKNAVFAQMPAWLTNKSVNVRFYEGTACMEFIEVTAQGDYNFFFYRIMNLFGGNIQNPVTISRTTQMRYNYQTPDNNTACAATTVNQTYTS
jgi:hypothetical protein